MVGTSILKKIRAEDVLYCAIDKLAFDFGHSSFDLWVEQPDTPFRKEVIPIGGNDIEFEIYTTSVGLDNYDKKVAFKLEYKGDKYEIVDLFYNKTRGWRTGYLHGKLWRMAYLEDFAFTHDDLIDFIQTYFFEVKLKELHVCLDVKIDTESEQFFRELDSYIRQDIPKIANAAYGLENKKDRKEITIGEKKRTNKDYFYKIYDKKLEIKNHEIENFYLDYVTREITVIRFEMELRKNVASVFDFAALRSTAPGKNRAVTSERLFNMLVSYFSDKKHLGFLFEEINFGNVKIKRQSNKLLGGIAKRITDTDQLKNVKTIWTKIAGLDAKTGAAFEATVVELDESKRQAENYSFFLMLYRMAFRTIKLAYEDGAPKDTDEMMELITGTMRYVANFAQVDYEEFFATIRGGISRSDDSVIEFLQDNNDLVNEAMYFYYDGKYQDPVFSGFMNVIEASKIPTMMAYFSGKKRLREGINKKVANSGLAISASQSTIPVNEKTDFKAIFDIIFAS